MKLTYQKLVCFDLLKDLNESLTKKPISRLGDYFNLRQKIETVDQFIKETPSFPGSTRKIVRSELVSAIGATLAIEGTRLTHEEIEESFEKADRKEVLQRKEQEADNSRKVYDFIHSLGRVKFSEQIVKQIHMYFTDGLNYLSNTPGDYRGFPVSFGDPRTTSLCRTRSEVEKAMSSYVNWLNQDDDTIVGSSAIPKAIMAHYYLSEVHPFGDGNGRTARAMEALYLFQAGINQYCFWSLANFWSANRNEYIVHLGNIRATCDPWDFIIWGMGGYLEEIRRIKGLVLKKVKQLMLMDFAHYLYKDKKRRQIKMNQRLLTVLQLLIQRGCVRLGDFVNAPEMAALYSNVSSTTRWRDFKKLAALRLVRISGPKEKLDIEANYELLEGLRYRV